jgi:hypothetical protein
MTKHADIRRRDPSNDLFELTSTGHQKKNIVLLEASRDLNGAAWVLRLRKTA